MVSLAALWFPILLSAVLVFVVSSIIHLATRWHANDFTKLAAEDGIMDALRPFNLPPGDYAAPLPENMAHMNSPEFRSKMERGPNFLLTVVGDSSIPRNLVKWFVYSIVVATIAAYVASIALPAGAPYLTVFRLTSTVALAGYVLALWQSWIWYSRSLGYMARMSIDGLMYALLTGGVFGGLWPS